MTYQAPNYVARMAHDFEIIMGLQAQGAAQDYSNIMRLTFQLDSSDAVYDLVPEAREYSLLYRPLVTTRAAVLRRSA